jgi:hypothetical protein
MHMLLTSITTLIIIIRQISSRQGRMKKSSGLSSISTNLKKTFHKMKIQSKNYKQQYLIVVAHCICDDPLYWKRKTFAIISLGIIFRFIVKLYFN